MNTAYQKNLFIYSQTKNISTNHNPANTKWHTGLDFYLWEHYASIIHHFHKIFDICNLYSTRFQCALKCLTLAASHSRLCMFNTFILSVSCMSSVINSSSICGCSNLSWGLLLPYIFSLLLSGTKILINI